MSFVPEITFPLLYHTPKLNCNFSSCKSKLDIYKNSCYSESRHHHLGWGEQLNPIQGFLVWVCGFMELLNTLPLDILLSVKNNLHLKNHLDILFITCIQISTIWLMNSILKRCKKKKRKSFPIISRSYIGKILPFKELQAVWSPLEEIQQGGNGIFWSQIF